MINVHEFSIAKFSLNFSNFWHLLLVVSNKSLLLKIINVVEKINKDFRPLGSIFNRLDYLSKCAASK
ncbi:hypothetical protein DSM107007_14940 [Nostoc sp. PCC 7120 = FACHB-418]|nr:hypothetical protein DSM107007_14940 [Nostoc sp. PCC 7120 = FACHB-418]